MNNMQFYIAIAIPSILVVLSWMQQDKRLARIEAVIDSMRAENIAMRDSIHRDNIALRDNITRDSIALRDSITRDNIALRDSIHRDMIPWHERMATVEARQG